MKRVKNIIGGLLIITSFFMQAKAQTTAATTQQIEIKMSKDSARQFFGVYAFNPDFKMKIFSESDNHFFAQRVGDNQKFQIFPKAQNIFFLKAMPAELEFLKSAENGYDSLVLHQGGKDMRAARISYESFGLYDTIMQLDSAFYAAYNNRDLKKFMSYLSTDLEFYHDMTGLTDYKTNLKIFTEKFADTSLIMRRELVPETAEVYAIKDFGAVEMGSHNYYVVNKDGSKKLAAQPKFVHVWKNTNGNWQIVRVISYDH